AAALVPHRAFRPQPVSRSDGESLANRGSHGEHVAITGAGCVPAVSPDTDSRERTANSPRRGCLDDRADRCTHAPRCRGATAPVPGTPGRVATGPGLRARGPPAPGRA